MRVRCPGCDCKQEIPAAASGVFPCAQCGKRLRAAPPPPAAEVVLPEEDDLAEAPEPKGKRKKQAKSAPLPAYAHLLCGWPLAMVAFFGGAIGGGLGGLAYGVNMAVYQSKLAWPLKIVLNLAAGAAAFGLWLVIAGMLAPRR